MGRILYALVLAALIGASVLAGTIRFDAVKVDGSGVFGAGDGNVFEITYTVEDFQFPANRELDIRFDAALYATLLSANVPLGFDVLLLQPNNPPGTRGDVSVLALLDSTDISTAFSVMVSMAGSNQPGPQDFLINQLDEHGVILSRISSGQTVSALVPEPATMPLGLTALLAMCGAGAIRRAWRRTL